MFDKNSSCSFSISAAATAANGMHHYRSGSRFGKSMRSCGVIWFYLLSPRISRSNHKSNQHHPRARKGVQGCVGERPRARIYAREGALVCCLHRLVLSFRRISVHIVTFFFFSFRVPQGAELCGVSPHCGGVLWGVAPHCGPTLRLRLVWGYLHCVRVASPRLVPH